MNTNAQAEQSIPTTMKAVVWEGKPYHVAVKEVPRPALQNQDDIIVKLTTSALCGSDLHIYHGIFGEQPAPWILGHEGVGVVVEKGSNVTKWEIGDRIVVPDGFSESAPQLYGFGTLNLDGQTIPDLGGLQAEYARVPNANINALKLPKTGDDADYIMLADIFCTAWGSLTGSGFQPTDTVAVFGAGPVGLLAAYSALLRGASRVYSVDYVPERLERAKGIGAIPIDFSKGAPADQILKLEPNGVKRSLDCIGYECLNDKLEPQENYVANQIVKVTSGGGGIFITGVYAAGKSSSGAPLLGKERPLLEFDFVNWYYKNLTMSGGAVFNDAILQPLLDLIQSGRAKPSFVIDRVFNIHDAPEAYKLFSERKVLKCLFTF